MTKEKLLIVGGGFIGKHLAQYAKAKGYNVFIVSLNKWDSEIEGVNSLQADITNEESLKEILTGIDFEYVINTSGYVDHAEYSNGGRHIIKQHFTGVLNLVSCLEKNKLKTFIQLGSSDEYGASSAPQSENLRELPISPYSLGKTAATHFLQMLHKTEEFPSVILRLFLVYGPTQDSNRFLPGVLTSILRDESFPVSKGEQLRDFCYIDDITKGIFKALDAPGAKGEVINLASGQAVSIRNILEKLIDVTKSKANPEFGAVPYRSGENMSLYANITKAKKLLDWSPEISFDEGILRTVNYYKNKRDD
jgi:nucleoside-diphosphate-sugar epimerase